MQWNKGWIGIVLLAGMMFHSARAGAQGLSLEGVLDKVQAQYDAHQDFQARFFQEAMIKTLGKKQRAEGKVYFKKPGKMRWIYVDPFQQEIISDGQTIWTYRPEEKQVIVGKMAQAFQFQTPTTFLAGLGNLKRDFKGRFAPEYVPGKAYFLEMIPVEPQGSLEKLFLHVDEKSFSILRARIQDVMGNQTDIRFTDVQFGIRLPDDLFVFVPPKGVEIFYLPGSAPPGSSRK